MYTFTSSGPFVTIFFGLVGVFFLHLALLFTITGAIFDSAKKENIKETTQILIKLLCFVMLAFITVLQIPFTAVLV